MRKLALLDVDGTLTDTVEVDLRCFLATLRDLFGFGSALLKLELAGLERAGEPLATASEAVAREEIFARALERAAKRAARGGAADSGAVLPDFSRLERALSALDRATGCAGRQRPF